MGTGVRIDPFLNFNFLVEIDGITQAAPAPRFSRTAPSVPTPPAAITPENTDRCLSDWLAPSRIDSLREQGLID
jgi:crotonobetainyl-CoA:carnitine CoA-transferase CaiB-like acyl-CoA transferase